MQTVPYILGIAHPTGFPLFVLGGWIFSHLLPMGSIAWRISLMSAVAMAVAARLVFTMIRDFQGPPLLALAGALFFSVGEIAWTRGSRAEVHAIALMLAAATLVYAARFARSGAQRDFLAAAFAFGLALANHPVAALMLPGILIIVGMRRREISAVGIARVMAIVAACMLFYAYIPLRSAYLSAHQVDPTLQLGVPAGRPFWDYGHASTLPGFVREVTGHDFDVNSALRGIVNLHEMPRMSLQFLAGAVGEFGLLGSVAVLLGVIVVGRREPWLVGGLILAASLAVPFALSYPVEADQQRYFLTVFWLFAVLGSLGVQRAVETLRRDRGPFSTALAASLIAGLVIGLVASNVTLIVRQRSDARPDQLIADVIRLTPPNAIVVSNWTFVTPLAYAAYAEKRFGDRIVESAWIDDDQEYLAGWLRRRPVYVVAAETPQLSGFRFTLVQGGYPRLFRVER